MKVSVSVFGRFHAFYLARQLYKRGALEQLITTYPKFETVKYGIPESKITSLLTHELMFRGWNKLPHIFTRDLNLQYWFSEHFDRAASRHIQDNIDLYVGWSSFSEHGIKQAKRNGAVTIVERGSAHIEYQRDILQEEYDIYGIRGELPHPKIVEKEKREYDIADYISVPSEFVLRTFVNSGISPDRLIKVALGVDISAFHCSKKHDDIFRIIFAGSLRIRKGVHYLIQAFAELNLTNAELWLVGTETDEILPFMKKYEGYYKHLGHIPQHKLSEYYSQSTLFILPSIEDGFGMVIPQAMATGLPIISTVNTGGADLISEGIEGFILPIRDVEALKEKILYFYQNQDIAVEMGRAAKKKVMEQGLSWDDYGSKIFDQYQERVLNRVGSSIK